jgi:hypothetical protein
MKKSLLIAAYRIPAIPNENVKGSLARKVARELTRGLLSL